MNSIYKNPYKTKYKLEIINKINRDGITYGKLENPPFFVGNERVVADQIIINGEEAEFLSGNKSYFRIDEDTKNVEVEIGWKNRLLLMQENLGNALVRHFLVTNTNIEIINYKVENSSSYIDVSAKDFKFMTAKNIESLANYAVFSNLAIENFDDHISIERLADIPYEGPALTRTGEIGMILISSVEKLNSVIRLTITSGENAYKLARNSLNILDNMKMYLNSDSINSVFSDVKKLRSNISSSRSLNKDFEIDKEEEKNEKSSNLSEDSKIKSNDQKNSSPMEVKDSKDKNQEIGFENKNKVTNNEEILQNKESKILNKKEKYDAKFFHEKYKLEAFKDLNKFNKSNKEQSSSDKDKEENKSNSQNKNEEKYDAKFFHDKYKLEAFKDLNKFNKSNKEQSASDKDKEENKSNSQNKNEEKYDAKFFHDKYKLEAFKDLNKFKTSNKEKTSIDKDKEENKSISQNKKEHSLLELKKKDEEEKSILFYQAVESFKNFSTEFSGLNYIYKLLQDVNLKELREISNYILKEDNFIQIYGLKNGPKSKILILRSQNLNFDLKKVFEKLKDHFDYTGTGNMYTLDIQCKEEDLTRIMESFLIEIRREAK
ncbi:alanyl-tRNS synthetase [Peptoniphilus harei]|uniref:Alanyl-tRNA synthetase n=1 Tax=Peptoniphilus harei TaxID=54005 RepID=A0A2X1Y4Y4_9FIRM|nr:alanyl-tRNS synthetase [Peptoniphilus harei]QQT90825.1 alanyl-tRNS synthetase [Peptoniphilus harei]SPY48442.1 Alanyl-tRNA synthetase [Peptoniphilus harei]